MNTKEWLDKVAYIDKSEIEDDNCSIYYSNFDKSYISRVGMEDDSLLKFLAENEITEELTHCIGFSKKDNKWYGWSHRAIFGFTIGSEVKKGDCAYIGRNLEDLEQSAIDFWKDECKTNVKSNGIVEVDEEKYFEISWRYDNSVTNKKMRNKICSVHHYVKETGNGEWIAKTLEDAKQMAIDFSSGVS